MMIKKVNNNENLKKDLNDLKIKDDNIEEHLQLDDIKELEKRNYIRKKYTIN